MPDLPRPVPNVPALRIDSTAPGGTRTIVIADLHLGLGATEERPLGPPEASAPELAASLVRIVRDQEAGRLVVAGDVKHPIVGAPAWLRPVLFDFFAEILGAGIEVEVVLGNHDVGLARYLPREVLVRAPTGTVRDEVGIFHGHRWPSEDVLAAPVLAAGHLHPGYRFAPSPTHPDGKHRCWVRVEFAAPAPSASPVPRRAIRSRELIVLPAFHPLAGAESLNRQRPARGRSFLYGRFLARGTSVRAYLLDGADLGAVPTGRPAPAKGAK